MVKSGFKYYFIMRWNDKGAIVEWSIQENDKHVTEIFHKVVNSFITAINPSVKLNP